MINVEPSPKANTTRKRLNEHVAGVAARGFLACFSGLLLLVLLLGENVSTVNLGRSRLNVEVAQASGRMYSVTNSQFT
jgi:hypothetical protein